MCHISKHVWFRNSVKFCTSSRQAFGQWTNPTAGLVRQDWRWPGLARFWLCWQHPRSDLKGGPAMQSPGGLLQSSHLSHHPSFSPVLHPQPFDWHPGRWEQLNYSHRINKHVLYLHLKKQPNKVQADGPKWGQKTFNQDTLTNFSMFQSKT